jgi:hypothetical protein
MPRCRICLLVTVMTVVASAASAQRYATDRGSWQLAGSASFTSTGSDNEGTEDDARATSLIISPRVRYVIIPGLAIGADATIGHSSSGDFEATALGIGPSVTYYFGGPARVLPYVNVHAFVTTTDVNAPLLDTDGSGRTFGAGAGVLAMLSSAVGVTSELFYRIDRSEVEDFTSKSNTFGLAIGIAAFIF